MSTATRRGRLFFHKSSLTKHLGLASSQFLDILYPWIGSIKGHYRLVQPGRRGSCGTLIIYKRYQQANVQFDLKTKSRTCIIAVLTYIGGNGHINSLVSPLGPGMPWGRGKDPPNSTSGESGKWGRRESCGTLVIYTRNQQANEQFDLKTKFRTCVIAVLTYIRGNGHINSLVSPLGPSRP